MEGGHADQGAIPPLSATFFLCRPTCHTTEEHTQAPSNKDPVRSSYLKSGTLVGAHFLETISMVLAE